MVKSYLTKNSLETKKLAEKFAKDILKRKPKRAFVFGLIGELGSGKTTFLQGLAKGLGIKENILSPTFIIMRRLAIKGKNKKFENFYHFDCYRIYCSKEILNLGFRKIIQNPKNIVVFEWADKIKEVLPPETIWLKFKFLSEKKRKITIEQSRAKACF